MIIISFYIVLLLICIVFAHIKKADIIISPIKGMMFGALYHKEEYLGENEYTIQFLFFLFSINIIWVEKQDG